MTEESLREMITIRLYQRTDKVGNDGRAPIYYVLADGRKRKLMSSGRSLDPKHFDNATGFVLRGADNKEKLNAYFKRQMTILDDIIIDLVNEGHEPTFEKVEANYRNNHSNDFVSFAFSELQNEKGSIAYKTYLGYRERLRALKRYKEVIPFNTINHTFLTQYRHSLIAAGRRPNGYYQDFATIKKFYKLAVIKGLAKGNPFENFKLEKEETVRAWLTKEELQKLFDLMNGKLLDDNGQPIMLTDAVKNTLQHFMFSCFTGIRFGDKKRFDATNIVDGRIHMKTSKTGKHITIPFNEQAQELLPHILGRKLKEKNGRVNNDLKECILAAGITKSISYHCSRHTFAINCILAGIDIITVRDWLGHKSVTTTEIYAKIAAQFKDESMRKMSNYFG